MCYDRYRLSAGEWFQYAAAGVGFAAAVSYVFYRSLPVFILLSPFGLCYPLIKKRDLKEQRLKKLNLEFKEGILVLSSFLSAGYSVENAFSASVKELVVMYGPSGMMTLEFSHMEGQIRMNRPVEQVLREFGDRSGLDDVRNFAEVFAAAKRSGGELVSIINHTSGVIRDKIQIQEEITTMTAAKQFEQKIMNLIPFFLVLYVDVSSPGFRHDVSDQCRERDHDGVPGALCGSVWFGGKNSENRGVAMGKSIRFPVPKFSVACAAAGIILYVVLLIFQGGKWVPVSSLQRASHGEGELLYEVMVRELGEEGREIPVTIPVRDRQYSDEEAKALYDTVLPELTDRILGGNESLEAVRGDLDLVRVLEPYGLTVRWESENAELVDSFGTVVNSGVSEEGETVWLKAVLTDGAHTQEYAIRVTVMPPVLNGDEQLKEKVMEACRRLDTRQKTEKELLLPEEVDGKKLSYYRERDTDYTVIPFWGVLLAFLWAAREKMKEQNAKKQREQLLLLDYSEIVSKFMVFISAGMTIRTAWERIAVGYENTVQEGTRKPRPAYEEMCHTISQLKSGMAESRAYGEFGRRCGLQPYVKLAALLEQNRKTGSKKLKAALELEMVTAFEQRKNLAKKLGEEAGTKLLLPLFLMLGVVMVMMVVPAFLAFY